LKGFVSYDTVLSAERAIENMNRFQILGKKIEVRQKRVKKIVKLKKDIHDLQDKIIQLENEKKALLHDKVNQLTELIE